MFLKFRVKKALNRIVEDAGSCKDTLYILCQGENVDHYFSEIKRKGFDADQGAIMIISGMIIRAQETGAIEIMLKEAPDVYLDFQKLWVLCGELIQRDYERWGSAVIVRPDGKNPFE